MKECCMKKAWKWILGIVLILVVVAGLVAVPFVLRRIVSVNVAPRALYQQGWNGPAFPRMGPRGFDGNRQPPMMNGRGFFRFGARFAPFGFGFLFFGGFLRLLVPLGLLALVAFTFYQMGRRAGMTPAPVTPVPAPAPAPASKEPEKPTQEGG
jgi:hypothetical protein